MAIAADPAIDSLDSKKAPLLEVLVFLFLIVPSMILSFFVFKQGTAGFDLVAIATILRDLALVSLVVFFLWRNKESVARIGWTVKNANKEIALGVALFIPMLVVSSYLEKFLRAVGFSGLPKSLAGFLTPSGPWQFALAFLLVVVVAVAEETIFRGYLMLRFQSITRSNTAAVLLSTIIFSFGHGYEGTAGVITVAFMGLVFAVVYLWRGSLVAPMAMHFLQDFLAIIAVPLLTHK